MVLRRFTDLLYHILFNFHQLEVIILTYGLYIEYSACLQFWLLFYVCMVTACDADQCSTWCSTHRVTGGKLSKVSVTCGPNYEKISNTLEKSTVLPCQKTLTGNMPQMGKNITSLLGLDLIETWFLCFQFTCVVYRLLSYLIFKHIPDVRLVSILWYSYGYDEYQRETARTVVKWRFVYLSWNQNKQSSRMHQKRF